MQGKKILLTGAKGLIGSALCVSLQNAGFRTIGVDLRSSGEEEVVYGDIRDSHLIDKLVEGCSGIVHLAGVSRVIAGEQNPELCWDVNVNGTHAVLAAALKATSRPWVIYASSREVYGQQAKLPVTEQAPLLPLNVYAKSKVAAEQAVMAYKAKGLQSAILRFSNVYGSLNDYPDRVIPAFCRTAAFGGTIRIDGSQNTFDFTYIQDVVEGIMKVIFKLEQGEQDLPPIHFTTGKGTTLLEAATLAKKASRLKVEFEEAPSRTFDVATYYGDPGLAYKLLGWRASVLIAEGIYKLTRMFEQ
jgi:nucleoside-diphosphate-sugar epimerase